MAADTIYTASPQSPRQSQLSTPWMTGRIRGTIKMYGCPAEENYDGKVFMVRAGLFKGVDACLSHHPGSYNTAGLGSSTAINSVKFHYYGKTSHAAGSPEQGRSALDAVELMNVGVNFLREHVIDKARIHYVIEAGGGQPNVVPDYARSWYYIRAPERDQVDHIYARILKIAEGAALMTETTLKVEFLTGVYNNLPSKVLSGVVVANMREIGAPTYTKDDLAFAAEIAKSFPKEQKVDNLRKSKLPNWEKYLDVDLVADILDPWNEGEVEWRLDRRLGCELADADHGVWNGRVRPRRPGAQLADSHLQRHEHRP